MKRMWLILMTLTLALGLAAGCACSTEPTPAPSPAASPGVSPNTPAPSAAVSPAPTDSGTPGGAAMTIPNFLAGTVVALEELPEQVRAAIDREYPDGKVQSIVHAEHKDKQVYSVTLTDREGTSQSFFIGPDGSLYSAADTPPSASPAVGPESSPKASPAASPKA